MTRLSDRELFARAADAARADLEGQGDERWALVTTLHERATEAVFTQAVRWCTSTEAALRCLGADVLAQLGAEQDHPFADRSEAPIRALLDDSDPNVLAAALLACGHLDVGETEALQRFATHASADVRFALLHAVGGRDEDAARTILEQLAQDPEIEVREWATFGLGSMTDLDTDAVREALAAHLDDEDADTRCEALHGLARRGDRRAVPFVLRELQGDEIGELAIEAAAMLADPSLLPPLESLLACNPDEPAIVEAIARCRAAR